MSKRKVFALLLLSGSFLTILGMNCLPNIGAHFPTLCDSLQGLAS